MGRSLQELFEIAETLRDRKVALRSLNDHLDTATAAGRMLYAVLGAVAQFERDVLRERTVGADPRGEGDAQAWRDAHARRACPALRPVDPIPRDRAPPPIAVPRP
ncbi:MAG: recombinase family protein [Vulcanimicrobiaceae bacterium]